MMQSAPRRYRTWLALCAHVTTFEQYFGVTAFSAGSRVELHGAVEPQFLQNLAREKSRGIVAYNI